MREIGETVPATKKELVERFGKDNINKIIEDGILIKNGKNTWDLDINV